MFLSEVSENRLTTSEINSNTLEDVLDELVLFSLSLTHTQIRAFHVERVELAHQVSQFQLGQDLYVGESSILCLVALLRPTHPDPLDS